MNQNIGPYAGLADATLPDSHDLWVPYMPSNVTQPISSFISKILSLYVPFTITKWFSSKFLRSDLYASFDHATPLGRSVGVPGPGLARSSFVPNRRHKHYGEINFFFTF